MREWVRCAKTRHGVLCWKFWGAPEQKHGFWLGHVVLNMNPEGTAFVKQGHEILFWHSWPWCVAVEWLVSTQFSHYPEIHSAFLTLTCSFVFSCLLSWLSFCQTGVRVTTAEASGSQAHNMLTCWKDEISSLKWHPQGQRRTQSSDTLVPTISVDVYKEII